MLYLFSVEKGDTLLFEMDFAFRSVAELKEHIARNQNIPVDKQVLLVSGGRCLFPACTISSYASVGIDTNPVFLFNKLLHVQQSGNSPEPQRHIGNEKVDALFKKKCDEICQLEGTLSNLKLRQGFAQDILSRSNDELVICRDRIREQHFQQQAWCAAVANLDDAIAGFNVKYSKFNAKFNEFRNKQKRFQGILEAFTEDSKTLAKVPLLEKLLRPSMRDGDAPAQAHATTLLEYVLRYDPNNPLELVVEKIAQELDAIKPDKVTELQESINKLMPAMKESSFKNIRGLQTRLSGLEELMVKAETAIATQSSLCANIADMAKKATKDQSLMGQASSAIVIKIQELYRYYSELKDYSNRCVKSKQELSENLRMRLMLLGRFENQLAEYTKKISVYDRQISDLIRDMTKMEQIHTAPQVYARCIAEVVRRKRFSTLFTKWACVLSAHCNDIYRQELEHRRNYNSLIRSHFLNRLFPGLDDMPPPFATKNPKAFDDRLPPLTSTDLETLKRTVPPELAALLEVDTSMPSLSIMEIDSRTSSDISSKKTDSDSASHQEARMFEIPMASSPTDGGYVTDNTSNNVNMEVAPAEKMCVDNDEREKVCRFLSDLRENVGAFACDTTGLSADIQKLTAEFAGDAGRVSQAFLDVVREMGNRQVAFTRELEIEQHNREDAQREIENYYTQIRDLGESLDNAKHEKQALNDHLTAQITNLHMEHALEMEKIQDQGRKELEHAGNQLTDAQQQIRLMSREHDEQMMQLEQKRLECEQRIQQMSDEFTRKEAAVRDELERHYKSEIEIMRCRYRFISDSGSSPPSPAAMHSDMENKFRQRERELLDKISLLENRLNTQNVISETEASNFVSPMETDAPSSNPMSQSMLESQIVMSESTSNIQSPSPTSELLAAELREQLRAKELEMQRLQMQLFLSTGCDVPTLNCDRISILSCNKLDLVMLTYDDVRENYVIFMLGPFLHFLHKDSLAVMKLSTDREHAIKTWTIGQVVEKEYCEARRAANRYKLAVGTRFFRVKVVPWDRQSAMKREQERRQMLKAVAASQSTQGSSQDNNNPIESSPATSI